VSTLNYCPWTTIHLAQRDCYSGEHFLEHLFWKNFQCRCQIFIFHVSSILKSSSIYGRLYFLKQPKVTRRQIMETGWVFYFSNRFLGQKLLDRVRIVSWSVRFAVENPIFWPKVRPFLKHIFKKPLQHFHIISLVDWSCGMNSKRTIHFISSTSSRPNLKRLCHSKTCDFFIASPHKSRKALHKCHLHSFLISHKI
jgi:hypothetical protein